MGTISTVIQVVELILPLQQAFNVLSSPMLIICSSFHIFLEKHSTSVVQLCSLRCSKKFRKIYGKAPVTQSLFWDSSTGASIWVLQNFYEQLFCRTKSTVSVIKLALKQVSKMTVDENLDLNIEEIVLHPFPASSFFSSFFRSFLSFRSILTFVKVHLGLSFSEFFLKDYSNWATNYNYISKRFFKRKNKKQKTQTFKSHL